MKPPYLVFDLELLGLLMPSKSIVFVFCFDKLNNELIIVYTPIKLSLSANSVLPLCKKIDFEFIIPNTVMNTGSLDLKVTYIFNKPFLFKVS